MHYKKIIQTITELAGHQIINLHQGFTIENNIFYNISIYSLFANPFGQLFVRDSNGHWHYIEDNRGNTDILNKIYQSLPIIQKQFTQSITI